MHAWAWYTLTVSERGPCSSISIHTLEYNPLGVGMLMTSLPCLILEPCRHTAVNGQQLSKSSEINLGISDQLNNIQTLPTSQKKLKVQVQDIQFTPLPKIPPPQKKSGTSVVASLL